MAPSVVLPSRVSARRSVVGVLFTAFLCVISYVLGIYGHFSYSPSSLSIIPSDGSRCFHTSDVSTSSTSAAATSPSLDFHPRHSADAAIPDLPSAYLPPLPLCPPNFTDYSPCHDPSRELRYLSANLAHRERHCPGPSERPSRCRVPRPQGYRAPLRWPASRDRVWFANAPSKRLSVAKKNQNWVRVEGEWLVFPGGGTSFPDGVKRYVSEMAKQVPLRGGEIRTVLDVGCGVASFGGHLLNYNILTMSVAPRDIHEAQVQFALERGLPAMLGVLSTLRLPYPSRSFDMTHCARCLVPWTSHDGLYLMEIDRVLRPGGYWVLSGPPINWRKMHKGWGRTPQALEAEQKAIESLTNRLCWKKISEKGTIAVWRKPTNHFHCAKKLKITKSPPFCSGRDPDSAWYEKMESCVTPLPRVETAEVVAGGNIERWPRRLNAVPPRISKGSIHGLTTEAFKRDNEIWKKRISNYGMHLSSLTDGKYRNIIDMNAGLGGFAAALSKYPVWVMNVITANGINNTLGVIYERGLIGTYMNWCEAFSTYPRTYDLIHADGIFSMYMNKCDTIDILLEMDRILRPEGAVIIRDHVNHVLKAKQVADQLGWKSRITNSEKGPFYPEKFLIVDNSGQVKGK